MLEHRELVPLYEHDTGERAGRFTIGAVREQEQKALAEPRPSPNARGRGAAAVTLDVLEERGLRDDQQRAFVHAVDAGGLKLIEGRAGTGKSHVLGVIREATSGRASGRRAGADQCRGAGPEGRGVPRGQHRACRSVCVEERPHRVGPGRRRDRQRGGDARARITGELLAVARQSGSKVILAGDDRQLASIERGGLFTEFKARQARPKSPRSQGSRSIGSARPPKTSPRAGLPRR